MSRALRALSATYVERRKTLADGAALGGAGKRAAFALFYGPLHYVLVREIVRALPRAAAQASVLIDLGCGTGVSGAAWARACTSTPRVLGVDRHPWALDQAAWTYRTLGLNGRTRRCDMATCELPRTRALTLAAFALNELANEAREPLMRRLVDRVARGDRLLIIEPLAGFVARWWDTWHDAVVARGGRGDDWRFRVELPPIVSKLGRAAGLDYRDITGRSLWLG